MDLNPSNGILVFTDGSSWNKDRSGGWAWLALDAFEGMEYDSGARSDTTNNQMELCAPLMALDALFAEFGPIDVLVHSDSEYVVKGIMDRRRKRNTNEDWWSDLDTAVDQHCHVLFEHVKGHDGHEYNELVDQLAGEARRAAAESLSPPENAGVARDRVRQRLSSHKWIPGYELTKPEVGGSEGLRRVRELRDEGEIIEKRKIEDSNAYEYRMRGHGPT